MKATRSTSPHSTLHRGGAHRFTCPPGKYLTDVQRQAAERRLAHHLSQRGVPVPTMVAGTSAEAARSRRESQSWMSTRRVWTYEDPVWPKPKGCSKEKVFVDDALHWGHPNVLLAEKLRGPGEPGFRCVSSPNGSVVLVTVWKAATDSLVGQEGVFRHVWPDARQSACDMLPAGVLRNSIFAMPVRDPTDRLLSAYAWLLHNWINVPKMMTGFLRRWLTNHTRFFTTPGAWHTERFAAFVEEVACSNAYFPMYAHVFSVSHFASVWTAEASQNEHAAHGHPAHVHMTLPVERLDEALEELVLASATRPAELIGRLRAAQARLTHVREPEADTVANATGTGKRAASTAAREVKGHRAQLFPPGELQGEPVDFARLGGSLRETLAKHPELQRKICSTFFQDYVCYGYTMPPACNRLL